MKFPDLVISEAKALKKHSTPEERKRLNFTWLFPTSASQCIYGQMTHNCFSDRAVELIQKCAKRVYNTHSDGVSATTKRNLNGSPKKKSRFSYWSPIEVFIAGKRKNQSKYNEKLIQFLKGEINNL